MNDIICTHLEILCYKKIKIALLKSLLLLQNKIYIQNFYNKYYVFMCVFQKIEI
jgi:hypothetical protein